MFSDFKALPENDINKIHSDLKELYKGRKRDNKHVKSALIHSLHYGQNINKFFGKEQTNLLNLMI